MFSWQTEQQLILSDKMLLQTFEQLRIKRYSLATFVVTADEDCISSFSLAVQSNNKSANVDQYVDLEDQFSFHLNKDIELYWIKFVEVTDTPSVNDKNPNEAAIKSIVRRK